MFYTKRVKENAALKCENFILQVRIKDLCSENELLRKQLEDLNNKYGDLRALVFLNQITK